MKKSLQKYFYTCSNVFKEELEFFSKTSFVGHLSEYTPRTAIPRFLGKHPIIMTPTGAFHNVCPHRGTRLLEEPTNRKVVTCPYHSWSFKLEDGINIKKKSCLKSISVSNFHGFQVTSDDNQWKMAWKDVGGIDWPTMNATHSGTWHANANWKLLVENFLEWYHLPSVHPGLTRVSVPNDHAYGDVDEWTIGFKTDPLTDAGTVADPSFKKHMPGAHPNIGWFHYLFPNMFWFVLPTHAFVITLTPMTPTKTMEHGMLMTHPDSQWTNDQLADLWKFYDTVNKEDIHICERMQLGMASEAFEQGWIDINAEKNILDFHKQLEFHF